VRVSGNLVTNSGETVRTAALQGVGISLAAGFLVVEDLEQGRAVWFVYCPNTGRWNSR
jgi:DNA-binding transcriptional LysR family regulator